MEQKPKLLVLELWGLGDLVIATPFLRAACRKYDVTLIAKPFARDLHARFWPEINVVPFVAPWTAFRKKYRLHRWPWKAILSLRRLQARKYDVALSARWDPRDHLLLNFIGAQRTFGFPRLRSGVFLTDPLSRPESASHRLENWRVLGEATGVAVPPLEEAQCARPERGRKVLIHSGAGQPVRVWPLVRYRSLVRRLAGLGYDVMIACDPDQKSWWQDSGETVSTPRNVAELLALIDDACVFVGNDSGPAHLAAYCGVPTFTIFGPQITEWFAPMHPQGECLEGKPCPYKPCSDYCRFAEPLCLTGVTEDEVWQPLERFLWRHSSSRQRTMAFSTD